MPNTLTKGIYLDDTRISDDLIIGLTQESLLYGGEFKVGSTLCRSFTLTTAKDVSISPTATTVKIVDDNGNITYTLLVDSVDTSFDYLYEFKLLDAMIKLNFNYDASGVINAQGGSATLAQIVADICTKAGIASYPTTFTYSTMPISWYDNTIQAREYISYIAELNCAYAYINATGGLVFKPLSSTVADTINVDNCSGLKIGDRIKYSKVAYLNGQVSYTFGDDTADTYYLNTSNTYFTDSGNITISNQVQAIYNLLNGYEFYSATADYIPETTAITGELISINSKPIIYQGTSVYSGYWINTLDSQLNNAKQNDTAPASSDAKIKSINIELNRQEGTITQTVSEVASLATNLNNLNNYVNDSSAAGLRQSILTQTATQFDQKFSETGVEGELNELKTKTTSITSNAGGITISVTDSNYSSNMNNQGFTVFNGASEVMKANNDGVSANNFIVDNTWNIDTMQNGAILAFFRRSN